MSKRALLIGINYFNSENELRGCHDDIDNIKAYLLNRGFTDFTILKDAIDDPTHCKSDCPTKANLLAAMKTAVANVRPGDTLYVHYSGHGTQLLNKDKTDAELMDECICPVDFNRNTKDDGLIRDDMLNTVLVKTFPVEAKLRVCFDSCHSGSALDLPYMWTQKTGYTKGKGNTVGRDVVFISGCRDDQTSADTTFNGVAQGATTYALISALKSIKHQLSWKDLVQEMRSELQKKQYDQIPQLSVEEKEQIDHFVDF